DVFDWGKKEQEIGIKEAAEAQAALEFKDAEARVLADVAHRYRRIIEAQKEVELARALELSGDEALRVVRNRYVQRVAVLSEVIQVQSTVAAASQRYVQALADLATAQADLERAMGRDR